jgi:thioredoxin 1
MMKEFTAVTRALSDPNRVKIVKMLQHKMMCVCEIQAALHIAQSTVSKHLKVLENASLVTFQSKISMKHRIAFFLLLVLILSVPSVHATADGFKNVPAKGIVTMLDLGASFCIPCKMMAPILEKLKKAYTGKAEVIFIDVRQHRDQAARFGIRAIPTQIFFDKDGKEVYRHLGFMSEEAIVRQLEQMGVKLGKND